MIRETSGIAVVDESVGVTLSVDALVVMADDRGDLRVLVDVRKDALPDRRVFLHLSALLEGERTRLFEQSGRKADLPDVVHEAAEVRLVTHLVGEPHARAMSRE